MPSLSDHDFRPSTSGSPFERLQAVMKLRLGNWALRTGMWGLGLFLLSLWIPGARFLFFLWLGFALLSGFVVFAGARFLRRLRTGQFSFSTTAGKSAGSSVFPEDQAFPGNQTGGRDIPGEVIEVEAEVLPPSSEPPPRG